MLLVVEVLLAVLVVLLVVMPSQEPRIALRLWIFPADLVMRELSVRIADVDLGDANAFLICAGIDRMNIN